MASTSCETEVLLLGAANASLGSGSGLLDGLLRLGNIDGFSP
jgi:hypothetical protein